MIIRCLHFDFSRELINFQFAQNILRKEQSRSFLRIFCANWKLINTLIIRGRTVKTRISARALILCLPLLGGAYSKGALIRVFTVYIFCKRCSNITCEKDAIFSIFSIYFSNQKDKICFSKTRSSVRCGHPALLTIDLTGRIQTVRISKIK